jgi:hypothetical protein
VHTRFGLRPPPVSHAVAMCEDSVRILAMVQPGTVIAAAGGEILIEAVGLDTGGKQRIALRRQRLAAIALGHPDVADQHGAETARKAGIQDVTLR